MSTTDQTLMDGVHVWSDRVDDRAEPGDDLGLLDPDERARARRFRFKRDRTRFVGRRAFLRSVLAGYLGVAPATIRYRTSPMGRPELEPPCGVTFSSSHADGLAIVAVASERLVGVDVERVRPIAEALDLAWRFFTPREYEHLRSISAAARSEAFLRLWTRKESYVKAVGSGMSLPFDGFDVLDTDGDGAHRLPGANGGMSLVTANLDGFAGFAGSVAVSGTVVALQHMTPVAMAR